MVSEPERAPDADGPSIGGRLARLAGPNILANLLVPVAGLVDTAMLGHLPEIRFLGGVALASVIFDYVLWTFGFLRMSTTGLVAQALGREDEDEARLVFLRAALVAVLLGLSIVALRGPLESLGFWILSGEPEVEAAGREYYRARIGGAPLAMLNFVVLGALLGRQEGGKVLVLATVISLGNLALDYLFIMRLGWAAAGAGWATFGAQGLGSLVGMTMLLRSWSAASLLALRGRVLDREAMVRTMALNGDIMVRTFALVSAFACFTSFSARLGTEVVVSNTVVLKVLTLASFIIDGFAFATESVAGLLLGQGRRAELGRVLRLASLWGVATGVAFAAVFIGAPGLFGLITDHVDVLDRVAASRFWLLPILLFGSVAYVLDGYFLGLSKGRALSVSMVLSFGVGFLPLALLARSTDQPVLLWWAMVAFMAARVVTLGWWVPPTLAGILARC